MHLQWARKREKLCFFPSLCTYSERSILRNFSPVLKKVLTRDFWARHQWRAQKSRVSTFFNRGAGRSRIPQNTPNHEPPLWMEEYLAGHQIIELWTLPYPDFTEAKSTRTQYRYKVKGKGKPARAAARAACREPKHGSGVNQSTNLMNTTKAP